VNTAPCLTGGRHRLPPTGATWSASSVSRSMPSAYSATPTAPVFTGASSDIAFPSLTDTLPSFPRYAALPRSEYYDGSAPPAPSAGVAPIPTGLPGRERKKRGERSRVVPTFTAVRSTGEAPGSTPAASPRLRRRLSPWPPDPGFEDPARSSPPVTTGGYAPRTSPDPPGFELAAPQEA